MGRLSGFGTGKPLSSKTYNPLDLYAHSESNSDRVRHRDRFKTAAYAGVRWVALTRKFFSTDDVWKYLAEFTSNVTADPRILGSVMRKAQKDGLIAPINEYAKSNRRACHGRMVRIWASLIFKGGLDK